MSYGPSSPVTGGAQTGFTSPTYTIVQEVGPDQVNGKQHYVSALGGTQTGVTIHTVASPFTVFFSKPKVLKTLQAVAGQLGLIKNVPRNKYKFIVRKGVVPLAGQPSDIAIFRGEFEIPAGAEAADPANIRALTSMVVGILNQTSSGLGDTFITGAV